MDTSCIHFGYNYQFPCLFFRFINFKVAKTSLE
nr:MAG TPA: hypothetical protein [Caudoviricetes sp.]